MTTKLDSKGVLAVAAIVADSSDLSPEEAIQAATALLEAYFKVAEGVTL